MLAHRLGLADLGADLRPDRVRGVTRRPRSLLLALALLALAGLLAGASPALAADGVGLYGRTNDKVVTYFGFGIIAFFSILVTVLSLIQIRAESRKERLRDELDRLHRP